MRRGDVNDDQIGRVGLWYPRVREDSAKYVGGELECCEVDVDLVDVRAANGIRIRYDFERDGYSILMETPSTEWPRPLVEVAFVPAWATGDPDTFNDAASKS